MLLHLPQHATKSRFALQLLNPDYTRISEALRSSHRLCSMMLQKDQQQIARFSFLPESAKCRACQLRREPPSALERTHLPLTASLISCAFGINV